MNLRKSLFPILLFILSIYLTGCFPASRTRNEDPENTENTENTETKTTENTSDESAGAAIIGIAKDEQQNEMYEPKIETTYLYWLDNKEIHLNHATKCNIYALNVLYKAGFKTPTVNALTRDLVDTSKFKEVLPIAGISDPEAARTGDLIVWNGHVIIFESLVKIKKDLYALAWWAGTHQSNNGDNIMNNVCYGKYKLNGYFVIRRPVKKN
jgi:hypothetical protein